MKQGSGRSPDWQCALCSESFADGDDSREHILPNAIGGRRKIEGFLCCKCNSRTGQEWDSELARQLNPISNLLGIKRERGSPPTIVVDTLGGRRLRHESDGRMTRDRVEISEHEVDGKIHLNVRAPSVKELKKHLGGLIRRYPQLQGVDLLSHAVAAGEYSADPMAIELQFGGLVAGRSVVKSCAALAHAMGVRLDDLELARDYLRGRDAPCFGYYNERDVVTDRPTNKFFHCVYVQGNVRTGKVVGYVEYFGYMRIVVLLSDRYRGANFSKYYAIDPVSGKDLEVDVNLPDFTTQDIQDIYDYRKVDFDVCRKALEPLVESYVETSRRREALRVIGEALDYARDHCGAKPGEPVTEEQRVLFTDLLLERLTPFLQHQFTVPDFGEAGLRCPSD